MPHPKFGKVGFVLGGGGARHGLHQAVQLNLFFKSGIKPDMIVAESVGASNALDPEHAITRWEKDITSSEAIYAFNPAVSKILTDIVETLPHVPVFPPKTPKNWREFIRDLKIQIYKIIFAARLIKPLLQPSFYRDGSSIKKAREAGEPLFCELSKFAENKEIQKIQAFLDMAPLVKVISENMDLEAVSRREWETYFLVRSLKTGDPVFLQAQNTEELIPLVCASSAIRALFPPVFIHHDWYCDGAQTNPLPVEFLFDRGCDSVFAFVKNYEHFESSANIFEALFFEESTAVEKQLYRVLKKKAEERAEREKRKLCMVHPVEPSHPDLGLLSISPEAIEHTIKNETVATEKTIASLLA